MHHDESVGKIGSHSAFGANQSCHRRILTRPKRSVTRRLLVLIAPVFGITHAPPITPYPAPFRHARTPMALYLHTR